MDFENGRLVGIVRRSVLLLSGGKFGQVRDLVLDFEMMSGGLVTEGKISERRQGISF
jgi:hypothetical protein